MQMYTWQDRQTDGQMEIQIERQSYILMYRQINKKAHGQMDRLKAGKQVAGQM